MGEGGGVLGVKEAVCWGEGGGVLGVKEAVCWG